MQANCIRLKMSNEVGSPGLVVMGGDSRYEGRGFESRCRILDGYCFIWICCKIVLMFVWKRTRWPIFFLKKQCQFGKYNCCRLDSNLSPFDVGIKPPLCQQCHCRYYLVSSHHNSLWNGDQFWNKLKNVHCLEWIRLSCDQMLFSSHFTSEWPDGASKSSPKFPKLGQKVTTVF